MSLPVAAADGGGGPLADAVDGDDGRVVEGGRIERARGVRQMVLGVEDPVVRTPKRAQLSVEQPPYEELLANPHRHRAQEAHEPSRRERVIGLEQALELQERLVVERHRREVVVMDARFAQDVSAGLAGERGVVPLPRETLLLRCRHDTPVHEQGRRAVVVEGRNPENGRPRVAQSASVLILVRTACR